MPLTIKPPHRPSMNTQGPSESTTPPSIESFLAGREHTPEAPPVSPLSPILRTAGLSTNTLANPGVPAVPQPTSGVPHQANSDEDGKTPIRPAVQLIDHPSPLPFSGEDSMDAIALRAAISSLQFQRVKAQRDLRTLQELKTQAVARPEEFRQFITDTAAKPGTSRQGRWTPPPEDDEMDSGEETAVAGAEEGGGDQYTTPSPRRNNIHAGEVPDSQHVSFSSTLGSQFMPSQEHKQESRSFGFPAIPTPQDVVRCPPIEWAKYHIHGESLDKIHKEQQMRPGIGGSRGPENVIAAPYNPFVDILEDRPARRNDARKDSGASAIEQPAQRRRSSKNSPASK